MDESYDITVKCVLSHQTEKGKRKYLDVYLKHDFSSQNFLDIINPSDGISYLARADNNKVEFNPDIVDFIKVGAKISQASAIEHYDSGICIGMFQKPEIETGLAVHLGNITIYRVRR